MVENPLLTIGKHDSAGFHAELWIEDLLHLRAHSEPRHSDDDDICEDVAAARDTMNYVPRHHRWSKVHCETLTSGRHV